MSETYRDICRSPIGDLTVIALEDRLLKVLFDRPIAERRPNPVTEDCKRQLQEYFAGTRRTFDLPIQLVGTKFQEEVWQSLLPIPFGETSTYGRQAKAISKPTAVRAVGAANGKNVLNIVVPCHRVIGASGSLTGYGGGVERKRWLLEHESKIAGQSLF